MRVPVVGLHIRSRCPKGQYAYGDPAYSKNRRLRSGYALVDGQAQVHLEGVYYLRYLRGDKRVWQAAGSDSDAALVALRNQEHDLHSVALGRSKPEPSASSNPKVLVDEAVASYLSEVRRFRSIKTIAACERILKLFAASLNGRSLASLRQEDILDHMTTLVDLKLAPRTAHNHALRIKTFL